MKKLSLMILALGMVAVSYGQGKSDNPLLQSWDTPHGVPPFDKIKVEHFMPAFEEAMKVHNNEIQAIISNTSEPTFENAAVAFDRSGKLLRQVSLVFSSISGANGNDDFIALARQITPLTTKHYNNISLNADLFAKIKSVYEKRKSLNLQPDQLRLVEEMYKGFVRGGINLPAQSQVKLRELNSKIADLQLKFEQNVLADTKAFKLVIEDEADLSGLPNGVIAAAFETAKKAGLEGKWVFTLDNPSVMPFLQYADNRELRKEIFNAYINRCNNNNGADNKAVIAELVALRAEKAQLMGYTNFAEYVLEDRMAKTGANVYDLLNNVWTPALKVAKQELAEMQELAKKEGMNEELQGWDWRYYSEKVMKEKYELNDELLRPYFKIDNAIEGIFYVANKLYGITFKEVKNLPIYHPDVRTFEVYDKDGSTLLAIFYADYYARPGAKRGGAWCGRIRSQGYDDNGKNIPPIVTNVCNFPAPTGDQPSLLNADEVETMFHEFGHALHGFFTNVRYSGISGVSRDFVELPSQINEHWAFQPEVLEVYAKHYETGKVIPIELVKKMEASSKYGQGFKTVEYTAASILDMDYHILTTVPQNMDVLKFETDSMNKIGLMKQIPPRYRSTYFRHTMGGGYTAGYYSYLWSEVLDADAFDAFLETGNIFDQKTAGKFRNEILSRGGSDDEMVMYINFRGSEPSIDPLLKNRGLK